MSTWDKKNLLEFIDEYRKHECIWKIKSKCYHNRDMKDEAYKCLLELVKKFDSSATKDTVLKKINNIRCVFRKEHKKVVSSVKSGMGTEEMYIPKLWYYSELSFLLDQEECLQGKSNLEENSSHEEVSKK